ncbi:MAG: sigma factor-like helix-turn-helix DNA-binding protein [Peptoniphilaceae bacterium]|nr:sigma factor-like helix-turn-helix DNA-binding protein [Peptoniphilaceae bacterium]MDY5766467.1 sigma factor-like helix-turn-helix DNA-binding protein [Peptoniphilaceae bacterium]
MDPNIRIDMLYQIYGTFLTAKQQDMIVAHYYEDLSLTEIGENLEISKQAVSNQLNRAVHKMEHMESVLGVLHFRSRAERLFPVWEELLRQDGRPEAAEVRSFLEELHSKADSE